MGFKANEEAMQGALWHIQSLAKLCKGPRWMFRGEAIQYGDKPIYGFNVLDFFQGSPR